MELTKYQRKQLADLCSDDEVLNIDVGSEMEDLLAIVDRRHKGEERWRFEPSGRITVKSNDWTQQVAPPEKKEENKNGSKSK